MIRTTIALGWWHRLALLFGGRLELTWYAGATGPKIANINVAMGTPKRVPLGDRSPMT